MKNSFSKKQLSLAVACALALGIMSGPVSAQKLAPNDERALWSENARTQIWKNAYGECWHNNYGPPPGYTECNPAPVAQYVAPAPAPAPYVAPVPAQGQYVAPVVVQPAPVAVPPMLPRKKDRN